MPVHRRVSIFSMASFCIRVTWSSEAERGGVVTRWKTWHAGLPAITLTTNKRKRIMTSRSTPCGISRQVSRGTVRRVDVVSLPVRPLDASSRPSVLVSVNDVCWFLRLWRRAGKHWPLAAIVSTCCQHLEALRTTFRHTVLRGLYIYDQTKTKVKL